ncbi:MAG TPA: glycosyltransferase, partial [Candidatus Saccharibacteria bacterium]|nr:glycosyltransferase [Candidatus Saccharibacteria bacterium]
MRNIGDAFLVFIGIIQSFVKLMVWRPDVVFTKGGYVCLPVGIAARWLRIPLVIHDSDAHPGLTNRILAKWATSIATGAPLEYYPYPKEKTTYVGVPTRKLYTPFSKMERHAAKQEWGLATNKPLIVVTGGGLGAKRMNDTVVAVLKDLMKIGSVVLISGESHYDELRRQVPENSEDFQLYAFVSGVYSLFGAADVVVTRAVATTILELAALERPTILVPNA